MQNYSKYPYNRLLEHIETMCKKRGEERDFVEFEFGKVMKMSRGQSDILLM